MLFSASTILVEAQCPDIVCTKLNITAINNTTISYSYEIKNIGTDTLFIGKSVIQNYVSPDSSLQGLQAAGGAFIFDKGYLMPGQTYVGNDGAYLPVSLATCPYLVVNTHYYYPGHNECNVDNDYVIKKAVVAPPVISQFTANVTTGVAPLTVNFTDQSTGTPTSWSWDFNNDKIEDAKTQNASFTYDTPGTYAVKLKASKIGFKDSIIKTGYVVVSKSSVTGLQKMVEDTWMVYPNPSSGEVMISFGEKFQTQNIAVEICDNGGRIVYAKTLKNQANFEYDFTGTTGTFIIKAIVNDEMLLKKVVIR